MFENAIPKTLEHVGHSPERQEALAKLTGEAVYTSDMALPGMLYAQIKRSPHASARILAIDPSRAERLPGVRAILTGAGSAVLEFIIGNKVYQRGPLWVYTPGGGPVAFSTNSSLLMPWVRYSG